MKFFKLKLLLIALMIFAAHSAFAAFMYDVSIDTSSVAGRDGCLRVQCAPAAYAGPFAATPSLFTSDGTLAPTSSPDVANGSAVGGQLPDTVAFGNRGFISYYSQGITFGNAVNVGLSLDAPVFAGPSSGAATFSPALSAGETGQVSAWLLAQVH